MALELIDLHHHVVPPAYRAALGSVGATEVGQIPLPPWDRDTMIEQLGELGIERALVSVSAPATLPFDGPTAVTVAQRCNDDIAELRDGAPERLGGFATLPLPNVDASLVELARALDELQLDGVSLLTNYDGRYLGDPEFEPLLAALDACGALVHVHPHLPGSGPVGLTLPDPVLEFTFDTTRAVADLLVRGTLERLPNIRFVLSHLGGALPFLAPRLAMIDSPLARAHLGGPRASVLEHLRRLYYDVALSSSAENLRLAIALVGADRLTFGSDVPFAPTEAIVRGLRVLEDDSLLTERERQAIAHDTAAGLVRRH